MNITLSEKKQLNKIGRTHKLRFIILHGSYAKGTPRKGSDLDIAYLGKEKFTFDEYLDICGELESVFGNNAQRELDVKELHNIDSLFRYYVVRDGILLYGNLTDYAEFKAYAYRDYMDSYDLRNLQDILLRKSIEKISQRYA